MKKSYNIIILILFFTPLITAFLMYGIGEFPVESPTSKTEFKIMTYNIHFGQGYDDKLNLERIAQNILTEDPDILGLQEVDNGRITTQGIDMALWLSNRLGMHYFYFPSENEHQGGCALLSKYPIKSTVGYLIPSISSQRVLIHGVVEISSSLNLDIFVTHLGLINWSEDMTAQVDFVLSKTNAVISGNPKILMGDFNLENDTVQIQTIRTFLSDTMDGFSKGNTFPSFVGLYDIPEESIDYIFGTGYSSVINSYVVRDFIPGINLPEEFGSDHLPVVTVLTYS